MNQTALQDLIKTLGEFANELDSKFDGDPWVKRGVYIAINEAKDRLEMEKQQIMDAATWGTLHESAEKYYEEKYNTKLNTKL